MALRGSDVDRQFFHRRFVGMLLCGLFFTCGKAVGQNSSPGDPCSYRLPHYEEDWSCVHNGLHSADPSDAIKDVALGERRDSNVSFGGEIRETYERFRNPNFGLQPQDPDGYLLQRYLIHADFHLNESMRAYAEALSAFENWRVGGPRPTVDEDKPANTIRIEPSLKASPRAAVSISAGWGFYWRESIHDGLYGIAGNLLVPGNTSRARYEGNRPILQADWQMNRHLSAHVNYIYVFNGPFGQQAVHGTSSMSYVSPWLTYEF